MEIIKKYGFHLIPALALVVPVVASAQNTSTGIEDAIDTIGGFISSLLPILIGIALLAFIWGLVKYVAAKDSDSQKEARGVMLYGVLALFVIVAVWGLVELVADTFGISTGGTAPVPGIPGIGETAS